MKRDNRERGQILILFSLVLLLLFGIAALAIDGSFMFDKRQRLAAAADAAAMTSAIEVLRNPSVTNGELQLFANQQVTRHGYNPGAPTSVVITRPPSGPFAGNPGYVEAYVSEVTATTFANVWGLSALTPGARAVAGTSESLSCLITFDTMSWDNLNVLNAATCNVEIGGNLHIGNGIGSTLNVDNIGVVGTWDRSGGSVNGNLQEGAPYPNDPLAHLPPPTDPGGAATDVTVSSNMTINAGKYNNITFSGNGNTLTLNPGNYYITGLISASTPGKDVMITGSDVMIFIAPGGQIDLTSNFVNLNLSGRTSGTYKGILLYQDRSNTNKMTLSKNNSDIVTLNGGIYVPSAEVEMKNNGLTGSPCGLIVVKTLTVKNGATLNMDNACGSFGGSPLVTISLAE